MADTPSTSSTPLAGRRALVTGGSRGIGRAVALALAEAGADVAITFREREAEAVLACTDIAEHGRRAVSIRADVSQRFEVAALLASVRTELGEIDILVNNAGAAHPSPIDRVSEVQWDEAIATNLTSAFLITQGLVAGMRERKWGRVIFLSSVAAQVGGVVGPHYAASKAGLHGLMHFYAAHLAKDGITANVIAPALIETEMVTSNPNATPSLIPVGRFGTVDEVASVVRLLAENAYITGQTINVNGGWYAS
ncbi:MAG: SDR family NAD(P)-dependent oxidoreductase [Vicinamibacteraceae bacterium]